MPKDNQFQADWVSAPGETIVDILEERQMSIFEFATIIGHRSEDAEKLIKGEIKITNDLASVLANALGSTQSFWIGREKQYRAGLLRLEARIAAFSDARWLSSLPVKDMVDFGWISSLPKGHEKMQACLRFFGVPNTSSWHEHYGSLLNSVSFKQSAAFKSQSSAVAAWLRQAEIEANQMQTAAWNPEAFKKILPVIRKLTRRNDPARFIPDLQRLSAECGVSVVILRAPKGCHASGATRFLTPTKALLILSARHLSDDHFWFAFFHEAGHLLLHGKSSLFLEGLSETPSSPEEKEADEFAASTLIPDEHLLTMLQLRTRYEDVVRFAMRIGVSAGIVVGQLQHHKRITYQQMNFLKRRFAWQMLDISSSKGDKF